MIPLECINHQMAYVMTYEASNVVDWIDASLHCTSCSCQNRQVFLIAEA